MKASHSATFSATGSLHPGGKRSQLRRKIARLTGEPSRAQPFGCVVRRLVVLASLALMLAGCGKWQQSRPIVTAHWDDLVTWSETKTSGVAGIDHAVVSVHGYDRPNVGETLVAVWAGFHPVNWDNGGRDASHDTPDTFKDVAMVESIVPSKRLDFEVSLHRDDPGTLTMFKQAFDLSQGSLFLVSFAKGKPVIRQLKRNLSRAQLSEAALKEVATKDPEINQFFKEQKPK